MSKKRAIIFLIERQPIGYRGIFSLAVSCYKVRSGRESVFLFCFFLERHTAALTFTSSPTFASVFEFYC